MTMKPVTALSELRALSQTDTRYQELTIRASRLLGGRQEDPLETHQEWLRLYAMATSEEYVLGELNVLISSSGN